MLIRTMKIALKLSEVILLVREPLLKGQPNFWYTVANGMNGNIPIADMEFGIAQMTLQLDGGNPAVIPDGEENNLCGLRLGKRGSINNQGGDNWGNFGTCCAFGVDENQVKGLGKTVESCVGKIKNRWT